MSLALQSERPLRVVADNIRMPKFQQRPVDRLDQCSDGFLFVEQRYNDRQIDGGSRFSWVHSSRAGGEEAVVMQGFQYLISAQLGKNGFDPPNACSVSRPVS